MKPPLPLLLLATVVGCSGMGSNPASSPGPVSWPTGIYDLGATIQYRFDSGTVTETLADDYSAVLEITPGGMTTLRDSYGLCREPAPREDQSDEEQRSRTFRCRRAEYTLEMSGGTIGGEIAASVNERIRMSEGCMRYRPGTTQCEEYRWRVNSQPSTKRARLTVVLRS